MKQWLLEKLDLARVHLSAAAGSGGRALRRAPSFLQALRGEPDPPAPCDTTSEEQHVDDACEFADLLTALGATDEPPGPATELRLRELEIAELQRNLESLRAMGDGLAELEQRHLAEREELERERLLAREEAGLWREQAEGLAEMLASLEASEPYGEDPPGDEATWARAAEEDRLRADLAALEGRHGALRERHRRLAGRWRALSGGERAAGIELSEARVELAEQARQIARLESLVARQERELARADAARERDRERLSREKERTAQARERAREQRERSVARGAELRELKERLRERDERLAELAAQWEALGGELVSFAEELEGEPGPRAESLVELLGWFERFDRP